MQPFADSQPDDIQVHGDEQQHEGADEQERPILRQRRIADSADIGRHRCAGEKKRGKIEERVYPIGPARHKSMKLSEGILGPRIQTALLRKSRGEFGDHECRRNKEECSREYPQAHRGSAVVRCGSNPARPQHRRDVEEKHIPHAHDARELLRNLARRRGVHAVASKAGISSSWSRKFRRNGSLDFSNPAQVPKKETRPS